MLSQLTAIYFEQSARSKGPDPPLLGPSALGLACVSCRVWVQLSAAHLDYDCDSRSAWPRAVYFTKSRDDENERTGSSYTM